MRIRLATLNAWALPAIAEHVHPRMRAIGAQLDRLELDVLALQEIWSAEARRELVAAGRRAGLSHVWRSRTDLMGSGLLVLSRFPIDAARFEGFALRGYPERFDQGEYYSGKGFVQLRLRTPAGYVTLVDTHLHARYGSAAPHQYRPHRAGQIAQLAMGLRGVRDPVIVAGDMNFREVDEGYTIFTGLTGARDVAAALDRRVDTVFGANPYRRDDKTGSRVDYVFARHGAALSLHPTATRRIFDDVFEVEGRPASYSNHAGVLAELEVTRGGAPVAGAEPAALDLTSRLLSEGREDALRRRGDGRAVAAAGFGGALLASAGTRAMPLTRRRLLRHALQGLGLAALAPGVGFSLVSELAAPEDVRAFDALRDRLSHL